MIGRKTIRWHYFYLGMCFKVLIETNIINEVTLYNDLQLTKYMVLDVFRTRYENDTESIEKY